MANNISQEQFDKSIVDAIKLGESKGLSDAQFESLMNQYQISAADVARATQSTPAAIQSRMEAATPTTQTEIAYNQAAMDELAAREQVPVGTLKSWVRRGLIRLRDLLEGSQA